MFDGSRVISVTECQRGNRVHELLVYSKKKKKKRHLVPTPHLAAGEETTETPGAQRDWLLAAGKA